MLNVEDATILLKRAFPSFIVTRPPISYNGMWLYTVDRNIDPEEDEYDPFMSVDQDTGEVSDFSILTDGNMNEIFTLIKAQL